MCPSLRWVPFGAEVEAILEVLRGTAIVIKSVRALRPYVMFCVNINVWVCVRSTFVVAFNWIKKQRATTYARRTLVHRSSLCIYMYVYKTYGVGVCVPRPRDDMERAAIMTGCWCVLEPRMMMRWRSAWLLTGLYAYAYNMCSELPVSAPYASCERIDEIRVHECECVCVEKRRFLNHPFCVSRAHSHNTQAHAHTSDTHTVAKTSFRAAAREGLRLITVVCDCECACAVCTRFACVCEPVRISVHEHGERSRVANVKPRTLVRVCGWRTMVNI